MIRQRGNRLGEYLRDLRHTKQLTIRRLASQVDCSNSLITRLEMGERFPRLDQLWRIVDVLGGDFSQALYLLCLDAGVPEEAALRATIRDYPINQ